MFAVYARVMEPEDLTDLKSVAGYGVRVQIPSRVLHGPVIQW